MTSSLGLESGTVRVVPYDEAWPALYAAEAARIADVLAQHHVSLLLEHTGSTAVRSLAAKPILDILAGRREDEARGPIIDALEAAGYIYRGEQGIAGRDFFRRGNPRQYHIHLTHVASDFWMDHLTFRDYLRSHPDSAAGYAALKLELAAAYPHDREAYIDGKTQFVHSILTAARKRP
jgi:GrpB-like predicted nucleotidyltransferase (UPF0157 family)